MNGKSSLVNTNKLVRNYSGCTGLKTGSTSLALYNLSASASRDGMDLIAVVMKAPTSKIRFKDASTLLDYGFSNFEYKKLLSKNEPIKNVEVYKGIYSTINAIAENDCGITLAKGQDMNIEQQISIKEPLNAPISKNQIIGTVNYILNEKIIASSNLLSDTFVDKVNFFSMDKLLLNKWYSLLRDF